MALKNFSEIIEKVKAERKIVAVAAAGDPHTLEAALEAEKSGLARLILAGDREKIESIAGKGGGAILEIIDEPDPALASRKAAALIRDGKADFIMKGNVDTSVFMSAILDKSAGISTGSLMSHFSLFEIPGYHKLLAIVDVGVIPYPTLAQKKVIIENTVNALNILGCACPKIGVLACIEKVNPKMPETTEAAELARMNASGEIKNCVINGPISYDCAMSAEIAGIKGYKGEVAGDVDVLVAPNIHAGNIMAKMLICTCGAKMAGIVVGAACPVILASRGSSSEEKLLSIALSAAVAGGK